MIINDLLLNIQGNARNNTAALLTDRLNLGVAIPESQTVFFNCTWDSATEWDPRKHLKSEFNIQIIAT